MTDGSVKAKVVAALPRGAYATIAEAYEPIIHIGNEPVRTHEEAVYRSIRYLAGQCDGAQTWDGVGFSKLHARRGADLAEKPFSQWGGRELFSARKILDTYKNTQIKQWWELIPDVVEPGEPETDAVIRTYEGAMRTIAQKQPRVLSIATDRQSLYMTGTPDAIEFRCEYNLEIIGKIKNIPGRKWDGQLKRWLVPLKVETIEPALEVALDYGFTIPPAVEQALRATLDQIVKTVALSYQAESTFDVSGIPEGLSLLPFQRAAVEFATKVGNTLFGDEMGLGKTVEALATAIHLNLFPLVVVCPASIKAKWGRECAKWCPDKKTIVLDSRYHDYIPDGHDIVVINYDILKKFQVNLVMFNPKCFVCDEAHKMKNPSARRTKMMEFLFSAVPDARRLFLSGTAIVNRPMEIATLIDLLGQMHHFGNKTIFKNNYDTTWPVALRELGDKLRQTCMVRRLKKDVLTELPGKFRENVPLDIDNWNEYVKWESQLAEYMAEKKATLAVFDKNDAIERAMAQGIEWGKEMLEFIQKEERIFRGETYDAHYAIVAQREALLRWEQLKQVAVKGKMAAVYDWLDSFLEESDDQKIVVFGWHTDVIKQIAARYKCRYIVGGMTSAEKDAANTDFQDNPNTRMIVGNIGAMGEGIDLFAAWHVAFVELGWSPKDMQQAEDRCHRMGQTNGVICHYLVAEGTIEDEIASIIARKLDMSESVLQGNGIEIVRELGDRLDQRVRSRSRR